MHIGFFLTHVLDLIAPSRLKRNKSMVQYVLYYEGLSEMGHDVNPDIEWSRISTEIT